MIRKTIFIAIVVLLVFFIYRGISPSGADKLVNKIASIRESTSQTGTTNTWGNMISGTLLSGAENSYERLTQSGTLKNLSGTSETGATNTGSQKAVVNNTGNTKTGTTSKPPAKTTSTTKANTQTSTNTNGLSQQDIKDLNELLNNIVE